MGCGWGVLIINANLPGDKSKLRSHRWRITMYCSYEPLYFSVKTLSVISITNVGMSKKKTMLAMDEWILKLSQYETTTMGPKS